MLKAGDKVKLVRDVEFMNGAKLQANTILTCIKSLNNKGLYSFSSGDSNHSYDIPLHISEFEIIKETESKVKMLRTGDKARLLKPIDLPLERLDIGTEIIFTGVWKNDIDKYVFKLSDNILSTSFTSFISLGSSEFEIIKETEMNTEKTQAFNLEDHLEEVLAGRLVKLRNGKKAKIVADLRADSNNQFLFNSKHGRCLVGFFNEESSMVSIWDLNGNGGDNNLDIIGLVDVVEFPENMWDVVDPKWNYIAIDSNENSWFYIVEPFIDGCSWNSSDNCTQNQIIKVSTTDWTKSLIKRPGV